MILVSAGPIRQPQRFGGRRTDGNGVVPAGPEGTMLGPAIFSGRVAGGWAAREAGFGDGCVGKPNRD